MMKKIFLLAVVLAFSSCAAYASDYKGNEKQASIFQRLGDLITGKYEVEKGKTLKEKGVVQVMADQVKEIKSGPVR